MEEGIVTDPREADVGSILGFGFAPYTGGALSYIDGMGVKNFVALAEKLSETYGPRFKPTPLLKDMAARVRASTVVSIPMPAPPRRHEASGQISKQALRGLFFERIPR